MPVVSLRLHQDDLAAIRAELEQVVAHYFEAHAGEKRRAANDNRIGQGLQVITVAELARQRGKSIRQIYRMEREGRLPRRVQVSRRRVGYLLHEIEGIPVEAVLVTDRRTLSREELAAKLSVHTMTVLQLVESQELPPPAAAGEWRESDIDQWLLSRPRA